LNLLEKTGSITLNPYELKIKKYQILYFLIILIYSYIDILIFSYLEENNNCNEIENLKEKIIELNKFNLTPDEKLRALNSKPKTYLNLNLVKISIFYLNLFILYLFYLY
jgi:hypothetical protein